MTLKTKLLIFIIIIILFVFVVLVRADTITIPGCNGKASKPTPMLSLYPGVEMRIYTCLHDLDNDGNPDLALMYVINNDNEYELIKAMRTIEYYDIMDRELEMREQGQ